MGRLLVQSLQSASFEPDHHWALEVQGNYPCEGEYTLTAIINNNVT